MLAASANGLSEKPLDLSFDTKKLMLQMIVYCFASHAVPGEGGGIILLT
jgi:hypothetical protein